ncbi:MAG: STAS domain-containing protein [Proteiniphilum sp.]
MNITIDKTDEGFLVEIEGRIDTTNYNEFEGNIAHLYTEKGATIYLDCSRLDYISSSGLRIFLTLQKKVKIQGGVLKIFSMQPQIKEIFDISGFSSIFAIFPDYSAAKEA